MVARRQTKLNRDTIIRASEIGQFTYCSVAWFLQRCGYTPESPLLEIGKKTHTNLGVAIDSIEDEMKRSRLFAVIGYILLCAAVIGFFYEVMV